MDGTISKIIILVLVFIALIIRLPYTNSSVKDKRSLPKLYFFILLAIFLLTDWLNFARIDLSDFIIFTGIGVAVFGLILLNLSHKALGKNWSPLINLKKGKGRFLVVNGPYKFIRHPIYLSLILIFLGLILIASNWLIGILVFLPLAILFYFRIPLEEKQMLEIFGKQYKSYSYRTKRFIPSF